MEPPETDAVEVLFRSRDPVVPALYAPRISAMGTNRPGREDPKQNSIHLLRDTGFAGVHPRKSSLLLNIRTDHPIESPRIATVEQVSRHRFHNELWLTSPDDVDDEIIGWLREAYALG